MNTNLSRLVSSSRPTVPNTIKFEKVNKFEEEIKNFADSLNDLTLYKEPGQLVSKLEDLVNKIIQTTEVTDPVSKISLSMFFTAETDAKKQLSLLENAINSSSICQQKENNVIFDNLISIITKGLNKLNPKYFKNFEIAEKKDFATFLVKKNLLRSVTIKPDKLKNIKNNNSTISTLKLNFAEKIGSRGLQHKINERLDYLKSYKALKTLEISLNENVTFTNKEILALYKATKHLPNLEHLSFVVPINPERYADVFLKLFSKIIRNKNLLRNKLTISLNFYLFMAVSFKGLTAKEKQNIDVANYLIKYASVKKEDARFIQEDWVKSVLTASYNLHLENTAKYKPVYLMAFEACISKDVSGKMCSAKWAYVLFKEYNLIFADDGATYKQLILKFLDACLNINDLSSYNPALWEAKEVFQIFRKVFPNDRSILKELTLKLVEACISKDQTGKMHLFTLLAKEAFENLKIEFADDKPMLRKLTLEFFEACITKTEDKYTDSGIYDVWNAARAYAILEIEYADNKPVLKELMQKYFKVCISENKKGEMRDSFAARKVLDSFKVQFADDKSMLKELLQKFFNACISKDKEGNMCDSFSAEKALDSLKVQFADDQPKRKELTQKFFKACISKDKKGEMCGRFSAEKAFNSLKVEFADDKPMFRQLTRELFDVCISKDGKGNMLHPGLARKAFDSLKVQFAYDKTLLTELTQKFYEACISKNKEGKMCEEEMAKMLKH
jgi:hypothetical protein